MIRINYQSDFAIAVTLKDAAGQTVTPPTDHAWSIHVTDIAGTCWRCGFDGTTYEDCSIDGNTIICYIDNPGFVPGQATITFKDDIPDTHFADGYENIVVPAGGVFLWNGASDTGEAVDVNMVINMIAPQITGASIDAAGDLNFVINYTNTQVENNGNDN